ncbi:DgyrCDS2542 [Dimorphilus gyrociliatus]|uniref:DgyrCDS2542 n=1 Tax=Dimorphilus gyrociliatus TaxID=2664684 RepID=A0A7I8VCE9_9ANNE|nr:DgyrCDS2542 [Dimorphilus gyrociliatus]
MGREKMQQRLMMLDVIRYLLITTFVKFILVLMNNVIKIIEFIIGRTIYEITTKNILSKCSQKVTKSLVESQIKDTLLQYVFGLQKACSVDKISFAGRLLLVDGIRKNMERYAEFESIREIRPSISNVRFEKPVFIVTLPRTGSTFLHCLMAEDKRWWAPPLWQFCFPFPQPNCPEGVSEEERKNLMSCNLRRKTLEILIRVAFTDPLAWKAHPNHPEEPEDVNMLLENQLISWERMNMFEAMTDYRLWLLNRPKSFWKETYEKMKFQLQYIGANNGLQKGNRPLLMHHVPLVHMDALLEVFPDASFITIHRQPEKVVSSSASLYYLYSPVYRKRNKLASGRIVVEQLKNAIDTLVRMRDDFPNVKFVDIPFNRFVTDQKNVVKHIYENLQVPLTDGVVKAQALYSQEHRQHKHGVHKHSIEDFGISKEKVQEIFKNYYSKFNEYFTGMFCKWKIIGSQNSLIRLHIKTIDLSFAPRKGCDANLDSLSVSDVVNGEVRSLGTFCKDSNPKYVLSYSNQLIIELRTKIGRVFENLIGVILDFEEISKNSTCLPNWIHIDQNCYYLPKVKDTFKFADSQKFCGYNKANLVKFDSREELDIVKNKILNDPDFKRDLEKIYQGNYEISSIKFWIGLNDLSKIGKLEWLDKSTSDFFDGEDDSNRNNRCVAMVLKRPLNKLLDISWRRQFCDYVSNPDKARPLCKRGTLAEHETILSVPKLQEERSSPESFKWWIIVLVAVLVILIISALVVVCIKYNRSTIKRSTRQPTTSSQNRMGGESPPPSYREALRNCPN